jgi:S-adenosylmethionine hydrolase
MFLYITNKFIVKNALPFFPEGTIHLVAIKFIADRSGLQKGNGVDNSRFLLTRHKKQIIICPDNGFFTLIDPQFNEEVFQIYYEGQHKNHFFLKDVMVETALHLFNGGNITDVASITNDYYKAIQFESYVSGNLLRCKGIYVDDFGNVITNITKEEFLKAKGKRNFAIILPGAVIDKISDTYDDVKFGEVLALFNTFGM